MNTEDKEYFLINTYCQEAYEQYEMKKWIQEKGIERVYEMVIELFYKEEDDV